MEQPRVVAVVVSYNRRELLGEALAALAAQTRHPDVVVVVDNASTDGSPDVVATEHPDVDLVRLTMNSGGAGGFAVGIERAVEHHAADYAWIMDDDTIPAPDALAQLLAVAAVEPGLSVLASRALWTDGAEHPMNTPKRRMRASRASIERASRHGATPVRSASFVSCFIAADAVRESGLPVAEYFIWNDDFEYTSRLLRRREGWYVPSSTVVHKTKVFGSSDADPGERFYFEVRNKVWLFRFSPAFAVWERFLYIAATGRRWARTWWRASDRTVLCAAGRRGWRDGWRSRPRPNAEVLAGSAVTGDGS